MATILLIVVLLLAGWFGFFYEIPRNTAPATGGDAAATAEVPAPATEGAAPAATAEAPPAPATDAAAADAPDATAEAPAVTPAPAGDAPAAQPDAPAAAESTPPAGGTGTAETTAPTVDGTAPAAEAPASTTERAAEGAPASGDAPAQSAEAAPSPGESAPTFDVVRVEPSGDTVAAGLAQPGAVVELLDGATPVARTEANERGEWATNLEEPLGPGTHDLGIRTISPDGKTHTLSEQRVAIDVPEQRASEPLVVLNDPESASRVLQAPAGTPSTGAPAGGETAAAGEAPAQPAPAGEGATASNETAQAQPGQDVASAEPAPGSEAPAASATPDAGTAAAAPESGAAAGADEGGTAEAKPPSTAPAPSTEQAAAPAVEPKVAVEAVEIESGRLYVAGSATTDAPVRVYVDDQPVGEARPQDGGRWILEADRDLAPGRHSVRVDQVGPDGQVIVRAEVDYEREAETIALAPVTVSGGTDGGATVAADMPETQTVIIRRGDNLWRIARRLYGRGIRYSTIYAANDDQIRNPHRIYPGQVFVVPAGDTRWTN